MKTKEKEKIKIYFIRYFVCFNIYNLSRIQIKIYIQLQGIYLNKYNISCIYICYVTLPYNRSIIFHHFSRYLCRVLFFVFRQSDRQKVIYLQFLLFFFFFSFIYTIRFDDAFCFFLLSHHLHPYCIKYIIFILFFFFFTYYFLFLLYTIKSQIQ